MLMYPQFDPIAIKLGPLAVHWYGLTYLVAFGLFLFLGIRRLKDQPFAAITEPGKLAELLRAAIWARVLLRAAAKVSGSAALKKLPLLLSAACQRSSILYSGM